MTSSRAAGNNLATDDEEHNALYEESVAAWLEHTDREALVDSVLPGFADRVLEPTPGSATLSVVAQTEHPAQAASATQVPRATRIPAWLRWSGGFVAAAGFVIAALSVIGSDPRSDADLITTTKTTPASWTNYQEPDPLGRPSLRGEGPPGAPVPQDLGQKISAYISDYGRDWGPAFRFHGTIVIARAGEVIYERGFGTADPKTGAENTVSTRFRLGVLTQPFTAIAIMQLRDRGKLALGDRIDRFLPNYPGGSEISVEQLLAHTSGIPNYTSLPQFHDWKDQPHTTEALLARFSGEARTFVPGTDFAPTNSGYFLLGAIIERVSGLSYAQYVAENILEPAGMSSTTFGDAYTTGQQAYGQVWNDEEILDPPESIDMSVFGAAGGLVASPTDLIKWDRALSDGILLSAESRRELYKPSKHSFGYGWAMSRGYGQAVASFPGAIDGFNGSVLRFMSDNTMIVVLCNTEVVRGSRVAQDVAMMVYGQPPPQRLEQREVKIAPRTYPRYTGTYRLTEDSWDKYAAHVDPARFAKLQTVHVRHYGDRLYFHVPDHGLTWMHPMGHGEFFFKDHSGNRVSFQLADDRARTMTVHYKDANFILEHI